MEIDQFAYNVGRSTRQQMADEMKRRSLTRNLDRLSQTDPGAIERMTGGGAPAPAMRGGGGGGQQSGRGPAGGYGLPGFWDNVKFSGRTDGMQAGQNIDPNPGMNREQARDAAVSQSLAALDKNREATQAITQKMQDDAYGNGGAYGRGIETPGGKPRDKLAEAIALKMAGVKGAKAEKPTKPGFSATLPDRDKTEFSTVQPEGDVIPQLMQKFKGKAVLPGPMDPVSGAILPPTQPAEEIGVATGAPQNLGRQLGDQIYGKDYMGMLDTKNVERMRQEQTGTQGQRMTNAQIAQEAIAAARRRRTATTTGR